MHERGQIAAVSRDAGQESAARQTSCQRPENAKGQKTIRFLGYDSEGRAVNQADIWLLPEELPLFIEALVTHPIPLPTNYFQKTEPSDYGYWMQIRSHESPKMFVTRLGAALNRLRQPA